MRSTGHAARKKQQLRISLAGRYAGRAAVERMSVSRFLCARNSLTLLQLDS
jgi:hypothetical protein